MEIKRIGRNPATDPSRSRGSQITVHNGTVYFAATPDRPFDPGASVAVQTRQMLARVDERLALGGSDKSRILAAHVMISDMRHFAGMNAGGRMGRPGQPAGTGLRRLSAGQPRHEGRSHHHGGGGLAIGRGEAAPASGLPSSSGPRTRAAPRPSAP